MGTSTPNYVLSTAFTYECGNYDMRTLPQGTFVRPIEFCYVPKHVLDNKRWKYFNKETEIWCYTFYGMLPIPRTSIRTI